MGLIVALALVLLIACANGANLLIARCMASTRFCGEGRNRSERLTSWIPSRRTCPPTSTFTSLWITTVHTRPQSSGIGLRNDPAFTSLHPYLGLAAGEVGSSAPGGIAQPSQST